MSKKSKFLKSAKLAIASVALTSSLAACSMLEKHNRAAKEKNSCSAKEEKASCSAKVEDKASCSAKAEKAKCSSAKMEKANCSAKKSQ